MLITNNFVFYGIGMLILAAYKPEFNGLFTLFLALLNISYSLLLYKISGLLNKGIYVLIGLSLTFITLTIPVQFTGNSITVFWAAEAVLLMWMAQKTQIKSYRFVYLVWAYTVNSKLFENSIIRQYYIHFCYWLLNPSLNQAGTAY